MKHFLLLILTLSAIGNGYSQKLLTLEPNAVEERFLVDLDNWSKMLELSATVTNTSNQTLLLKWKRNIVNQPLGWQTQVCDDFAFYTPEVATNYAPKYNINAPVELAPGASLTFSLHIQPMGVAGRGVYEIPFSLTKSPDKTIGTLILTANVEDADKEFSKASLRLFPNPAIDYFEITPNAPVDEIVLYNMIGKKIRMFDASQNNRYDISDIPAGLYLVSLINEKRGVLKTLRLNKRTLRP
jgi:hypothetical protein